jgi:hypothetical protein
VDKKKGGKRKNERGKTKRKNRSQRRVTVNTDIWCEGEKHHFCRGGEYRLI